jgi:ATP-dependent Clp protease adapter protein ClpS
MRDVPEEAHYSQIVVYNDDQTPWEFVVELMQSVFGKTESEAKAFATKVGDQGQAVCGQFPTAVANAFVKAAQKRVENEAYPLSITALPMSGAEAARGRCSICGTAPPPDDNMHRGAAGAICNSCILSAADKLSDSAQSRQFKYAHAAIAWHFAGVPKDQLVTTSRKFPGHMRPDVQAAIDANFTSASNRFFGIHEQHRYETMTLATLTVEGQYAPTIAPAQYQDVDIGNDTPARCLTNGVWLCRDGNLRFVVVLSFHREFGQEAGMCIEIGVPAGDAGSDFINRSFSSLERAVHASRSYRGKVLSLEDDSNYSGKSKGMTVHRLPAVSRDQVILPDATLELLDRNVLKFVEGRDKLRALRQSTRKGILLYGPPGTGKTHTIRYLSSHLPGHTTLIITAGQVGLLGAYMNLARLLQPALVVIEDVDLIARDREQMGSACEESLLNKLLNEMDGLKDDADILFVLTTNRPEQLEGALAGRPGRIDQAIEVPLPDAAGREKLVRLYGKGLKLDTPIVAEAVKRTSGASAAFIKELMRRAAQASIQRDRAGEVTDADLSEALDDMLFTGGKLNIKLLGGAAMSLD